jgi:hypothetical protein
MTVELDGLPLGVWGFTCGVWPPVAEKASRPGARMRSPDARPRG